MERPHQGRSLALLSGRFELRSGPGQQGLGLPPGRFRRLARPEGLGELALDQLGIGFGEGALAGLFEVIGLGEVAQHARQADGAPFRLLEGTSRLLRLPLGQQLQAFLEALEVGVVLRNCATERPCRGQEQACRKEEERQRSAGARSHGGAFHGWTFRVSCMSVVPADLTLRTGSHGNPDADLSSGGEKGAGTRKGGEKGGLEAALWKPLGVRERRAPGSP